MDYFAFDDDYVRRLREGDRWTVEHYYRYFQLFLTLKLRKRGVPSADVDDLIQDVHARVLNALRSEDGVRNGHSFGAFVNSIANHVLQEYWRRDRHTEELEDIFAGPDNQLRDLITEETKERVHRVLRLLEAEDARSAQILRDLFLKEREKDAVCTKYGVDRDYLRVLVHRALKKFREKYGPPDDS